MNTVTLTEREQAVVNLVSQGWKDPDIAECLGISIRTTNQHINHIYDKYYATGLMDNKHPRVMIALIANGVIGNGTGEV